MAVAENPTPPLYARDDAAAKPNSNLSLVLSGPQQLSFEPRPYPQISDPRDVLVKVVSTGICGSDLHYYRHGRVGNFVVTSPMVLGHESAGVVQQVGSAVTSLKVGDRVALEPGVPCRYCSYCRQGRYNLCRSMRFAATPPIDGTLTEVYRLPEDYCHQLPTSVSLEEGALLEPVSVAVHIMVKQAAVTLGSSVVVFGAGPIGLLCCAVARAYGARKVVAIDINKSRLEFAKGYAATDVFDVNLHSESSAEETAQHLLEQTEIDPIGVDIAVDASGVQSSIRTGIHALRPGGTFVQGGMSKDDIHFPISALCSKEINMKGSFRYGPGDYDTAIQLLKTKRVVVTPLITKRVPFRGASEAFAEMASGRGIKTLISGPSVVAGPIGY
jgi:D-xylulose reductase